MPPGSAAATCDLCGREIVADRAEHYRRHLENARAYLELVEKRGEGFGVFRNRSRVDPGHGPRCYVQGVDGDNAPRAVTPEGTTLPVAQHALSPDSRFFVALGPDHVGRVYSVDGGEPRAIRGIQRWEIPLRWSADGGALYVARLQQLPVRVDRLDIATGARELWRELAPSDPTGVTSLYGIQISPERGWYFYSYWRVLSDLYVVGLAKLVAPSSSSGMTGLSILPTTPKGSNLTAEGTILGTFQYMAPEQLEGKEADARTDIFAFGAVLYEMATSQKAFSGKSQASLIASILERDPPAISSVQPMTPPALDRVVKICLAKDPEDRWQSAHDIASELAWIAPRGAPRPASRRRPPCGRGAGKTRLGARRFFWPPGDSPGLSASFTRARKALRRSACLCPRRRRRLSAWVRPSRRTAALSSSSGPGRGSSSSGCAFSLGSRRGRFPTRTEP